MGGNGHGPNVAIAPQNEAMAPPPAAHRLTEAAADPWPDSAGVDVPPPPPRAVDGNALTQAFLLAQESLRAMQYLQQQTAIAHQHFLQGQETAHRSFQLVIQNQQRLLEQSFGAPLAALPSLPERSYAPPAFAAADVQRTPAHAPSMPAHAPPAALAASGLVSAPYAWDSTAGFSGRVEDPHSPSRRVEDSHSQGRRVEDSHSPPIGGAIGFSSAAPNGKPTGRHTANAISARAASGSGKSQPVQSASVVAALCPASLEPVLLEVVAQLTGYPVEMLRADMDLEADLGIDSIKRLEILATVQERRPDLRQVDSQYLGSLRTLCDIVAHLSGAQGGGAPAALAPSCGPQDAARAPSCGTQAATAGASGSAAGKLVAT